MTFIVACAWLKCKPWVYFVWIRSSKQMKMVMELESFAFLSFKRNCFCLMNKFDMNKDASNKCENEWIFLNFLEFSGIYLNSHFLWNAWQTDRWTNRRTKPLIESERSCVCVCISTSIVEVSLSFLAIIAFFVNGLRTDWWMARPPDQQMDKASYRDAWTHLKINVFRFKCF